MTNIEDAMLHVTMPDGSVWAVPVAVIAWDRAKRYAHEYGGDINRSQEVDTIPLFESDDYEIEDWAANNMNWGDVQDAAIQVSKPALPDYQEGWVNGKKQVVG